jgi:sugar/nucleoside kinase (ribokinase family)
VRIALAPARDGSQRRRGSEDPAEDERAQPSSFATVHETIVGMLVCTLGDVLLDVIVRLEQPLAEGDDTPASVQTGAGGQAGNVAAWAVELGAQARVLARRGDDELSRLVDRELLARGVELVGPVGAGRGGIVVSLVGPDGERSMLSDRGLSSSLRAEDVDVAWLRGCDALHLSGYALLGRPIDEAGARAAGAVRALGGRVSVDLSTAAAIRSFGPARFLARLAELRPDVVFAGEAELAALAEAPPASTLVVKHGPRGFTVVDEGGREAEYAAADADVVDTTGAGDALAAGFIVGGPELALEAAARCVSKVGALP